MFGYQGKVVLGVLGRVVVIVGGVEYIEYLVGGVEEEVLGYRSSFVKQLRRGGVFLVED